MDEKILDFEIKKKLFLLFTEISKVNSKYQQMISRCMCKLQIENMSLFNVQKIYECLPIMEKSDIIKNDYLSDIRNENILYEVTSGTTGEPIKCKKTLNERVKLSLVLHKNRLLIDEKFEYASFFSMYGNEARRLVGDFFDFSPENIEYCFNEIQKRSIKWLVSSVTTMRYYAKTIKAKGLENKCIKYIEVMGEVLDEYSRKYIEDAFNAKVINHYGMRETWCIAYECKCGKLHLCDNITAYTNSDDEIIVTNFNLCLMPIIKYNTHDKGNISISKCECGNKNQVVTLYGGRNSQIISGQKNVLGDLFFKRIFGRLMNEGYDYIKVYRVIQKRETIFWVYIELDHDICQEEKNRLKSRLSGLINQRLERENTVNVLYKKLNGLTRGKNLVFINDSEGN